jgi:thiamine-monophosphate kinase
LLITTDAGPRRAFLTSLGIGSFVDLGHFFATISFSDIAAMAGRPLALVAAFICQGDLAVACFKDLVDGISRACEEVEAKYIGGDTNEGAELRVVTTALGIVDNDKILTRRGAQVEDVVCTSGTVGKALHNYLVSALHQRKGETIGVERPHARIEFGQLLGRQRLATACMDMSDGLIATAKTIGEMNQVVLNLDLDTLQMTTSPVDHLSSEAWKELVLNVGGDFELMFTARPSDASAITKLGGIVCGSVVAATENAPGVRLSGSLPPSKLTPWEHFRSTSTISKILKELL